MLAHPEIPWVVNIDLGAASGYGSAMSPHNHGIPLAESQVYVINPTNPRGAFDDRIEHPLHVCGRPADDPEHLGCCALMVQSIADFGVALLNLLKQSRVLAGV